jgi:N-acetylmuramic acid 6-phosphate etherase
VECPPTFNTDPDQVIGLIAGGQGALFRAIEGAEDSPQQGREDLKEINLDSRDVVVGITASGRTPYVLGALDYARETGAATIGLACNADSELPHRAALSIIPVVGPEILTGSTRMKAGTATKMVLNMLTTGAMVLMGKTWGNLMVDVRASNEKLVERSIRIVQTITGASRTQARETLERCEGEVKLAVIVQKMSISPAQARKHLQKAGGHLAAALEQGQKE